MLTTNDLDEILKTKKDINRFLKDNEDELLVPEFTRMVNTLLNEKNKKRSDITHNSLIPERYVYEIFSGSKLPGRDRIIQIALVLNLSVTETNHLLNSAHASNLYSRNPKDSIIIYCLNNKKNVMECNEYLDNNSLSTLC